MAKQIWIACVGAIVAVILCAGIVDIWLRTTDRQTISQWLRDNPEWYWTPVIVLAAFLLWLGRHLFAQVLGGE